MSIYSPPSDQIGSRKRRFNTLAQPTSQSVDWECGSDRPYGNLAKQTIDFFSGLKGSSLTAELSKAPDEYKHKESLNGRFRLWSLQWSIERDSFKIGVARMVIIQGQKNEIINTWVFPTVPSLLPVFAAELIAMGGQQRLTFIDIQVPGMDEGHHLIAEQTSIVRHAYKDLLIDEVPPAWAITDTLGQYIFGRTGGRDQFAKICSCYRAYLSACIEQVWLEIIRVCNAQGFAIREFEDDSKMAVLRDYQRHHLHSSPGNSFLSKLFGRDWTHQFLHEYLFSKP